MITVESARSTAVLFKSRRVGITLMMIAKYIINPYPARLVLFISLGIFSVLNEVLGRD